MAQTTTDTVAGTVSGAGAASSFSGGTGTEAEFGSLGALSPTWWEPEDGSEPEPWLTPDQAFERFFEWTSDRGIELWDHQEEALMDLAAGDHVILGTPTGSGKSLVALGMLFMGMAQGKRCYYTAPIKALVSEKFFDLVQVLGRDNVGMITGDTHINTKAPVICCTAEILANDALREGEDAESLGLTGEESFTIRGLAGVDAVPDEVTVTADGRDFTVIVRLDTDTEQDYYRHGGILPYVLRERLA